ncbi:MAG: cytochrome c, partial [Caulobacteraceae bacterium]|nr:cytochrome c [Caulobacteraceae bacterium]
GCGSCHAHTAKAPNDLAVGRFEHGGDIVSLYTSIAAGRGGMPAYGARIPAQQIWQLAAYVKSLPKTNPYLRLREDRDDEGQPTAKTWRGAVR